MTRRWFLRALLGGAPPALTAAYAFGFEPQWLEFTRMDLPVAGLPPALDGKILAHLSDFHVGPRVSDRYIVDVLERTARYAPDITVATGDFITYRHYSVDRAKRVYASFPRGRLATLAVLGNHDYGPAWSHSGIAAEVSGVLRAVGVDVLRNETREVEGLCVAGLDDLWAPNFAPRPVLDAIDRTRPVLVLSHNPDTVDLPGWDGIRGCVLSGHTHGGQVRAPFLKAPVVPVRNKRYTSGWFSLAPGRSMYISRGIGFLVRVRCLVRPEVAVFRLRRT
jgi:hypothetical protein